MQRTVCILFPLKCMQLTWTDELDPQNYIIRAGKVICNPWHVITWASFLLISAEKIPGWKVNYFVIYACKWMIVCLQACATTWLKYWEPYALLTFLLEVHGWCRPVLQQYRSPFPRSWKTRFLVNHSLLYSGNDASLGLHTLQRNVDPWIYVTLCRWLCSQLQM